MKGLRFLQVDVFTDRPFLGNPVAVVIGGETLKTEAMQRIACWTNLSETTFLLPSKVADYRLRIFTPRRELPFAGHPTIGSAHAALEARFVARKKKLTQECGAGIIELAVRKEGIFLTAPQARISPVAGALPYATNLRKVDVGPVWIIGEVASASALAALAPDMAELAAFTDRERATGVTLFAPSGEKASAIHVRSFAPAQGINEDPVCGSGNISVAAYLRFLRKLDAVGNSYVARQGMQLGRDGSVSIRVSDGAIEIGGRCVTCVEGSLTVPT
ncbi:MAG TPA: PhzF family phenazine biosynthesis protein [Burkholderiales bacterium]